MSYLPETEFGDPGFTKGRNVREGYQRAWGLQFTKLSEYVKSDPLFKAALHFSHGRSILSVYNRLNLFLLLKFFLPQLGGGNIIEFGCYKGGNALFMAYIAEQMLPGKVKVFALDTFSGMPKTDDSIDAHKDGDFNDVDLAELEKYKKETGINNLEFIKGTFEETAEQIVQNNGPFALAHIDCDIRSAVAYSYDIVKPHMLAGGYYVFDDANLASCLGATEAIEELVIRRDGLHAEQVFPHYVFRAPPSS